MANLSREQVHLLGRLAGLELDDSRAETIAARLGLVLDELDLIPDEAISDMEPLPTFTVEAKERNG